MEENQALINKKETPIPPTLPCYKISPSHKSRILMADFGKNGRSCVSTTTRDMWDRLFDDGYRADVAIITENGDSIYAHSSVLGMASPVLKGLFKQAKSNGKRRSIFIKRVSHDAVRVFIRYLYSSCYEKEEIKELGLHLLVLSHVYVVPDLKKVCEQTLTEPGFLTTENVVDIIQLALLCDAPRLSLFCHQMILRNIREISLTDGWFVMRQSHPKLEKQIQDSVVDEHKRRKERIQKSKERKIYIELYEAMEALVHICRDGCRTIGPHDKDFEKNQTPCHYSACKGFEQLIRHFASCKLRMSGGCIHCKRMWRLLELHSRLCANSNACRVPLCKDFKVKTKQSKKDEIRWSLLVNNILTTKRIRGSPFFSSATV